MEIRELDGVGKFDRDALCGSGKKMCPKESKAKRKESDANVAFQDNSLDIHWKESCAQTGHIRSAERSRRR